MAESAFSTACNDRELKVKQVRIVVEQPIVKQRKSLGNEVPQEQPFGTIKWAMEAG